MAPAERGEGFFLVEKTELHFLVGLKFRFLGSCDVFLLVEVVFQHVLHLMFQFDSYMFQLQIHPNPMQSGWGEKYS